MVDKRDTMLRAAFTAEGAKHSKSVIFWLGGGWKIPAVLIALGALVLAFVKGLPYLAGHASAFVGPLAVVVVIGGIIVALALLARGGGRGRRF